MNIVAESYDFLQEKLLPQISGRHRKLFTFGFEALTLRPFTSLNGNARITLKNRSTAESKIYRLVSHPVFLEYFPLFVNSLHLIYRGDIVNVDFSTFCGFHVLTFARQTQNGRAIPLYIATITYPVTKGSQTQFVMDHIGKVIELLGFFPTFVFDRGFESPYIIPFLVEGDIPFVVRVKMGKHVQFEGKQIPLYNMAWSDRDCMIRIYQNKLKEKKLRIVISEKNKKHKEPWYLLTNILDHKRETILSWYYFRFEIEETFKDIKHIFELKKFYKIKTIQTFQILLWFVILGIWMAFFLDSAKYYFFSRIRAKRKKRLSVVRHLFESIQLELFSAAKQQFF